MSIPKCETCGREYVKTSIPCPDWEERSSEGPHTPRCDQVGSCPGHFKWKRVCECESLADTSQQRQRERADKIATMIAGGLPNCPPIRELIGAIQLALEATEPEVVAPPEPEEQKRDRNKLAQTVGLADQTWKSWDQRLPDIKRIANEGPNGSEEDLLLIRGIIHAVSGDMFVRRHQAAVLDAAEGGGA